MIVVATTTEGVQIVGLCEVELSDEKNLVLWMPMLINNYNEDGNLRMALTPYSMFTMTESINKANLLSISDEPIDMLCDLWEKMIERDMNQLETFDSLSFNASGTMH